jgi:hypothetical protein
VEFFEKNVSTEGTGASSRKIGEDLEAPYELKRSVAGPADNGDMQFSARGYDDAGHVGLSNVVAVTVAITDESIPFQATVTASHTRLTTPGRITFAFSANKPIARAELYTGTTKVGEVVLAPFVFTVPFTQADNGNHTYVVKVHAVAGQVVESAAMPVEVDIRWVFAQAFTEVIGVARSVTTDAANSVYIAGGTTSRDVVVIKADAGGNQQWVRNFGGADWETANSIGVDPSGRIYVAGHIYNPGSDPVRYSCFLTLYDASGNPVRTQSIGGTAISNPSGCVAATDASGNFYVLGFSRDATDGGGFVVKYDRDGNSVWSRKFGGAVVASIAADEVSGIAVDLFGGVYATGHTSRSFDGAPPRGPRDVFLVKFDADGNRLWARQYGTGKAAFAWAISADPAGGVYIAGQVHDVDDNFCCDNVLALHYGTDGTLLWARSLDGGGEDFGRGVVADETGVYIVGGTDGGDASHEITEASQGSYDRFLARFSRNGDREFVRLLGSPVLGEWAGSVAIALNGDVYVAGDAVTGVDAAGNFIGNPLLARHRAGPP